jgi:hypothetical protein
MLYLQKQITLILFDVWDPTIFSLKVGSWIYFLTHHYITHKIVIQIYIDYIYYMFTALRLGSLVALFCVFLYFVIHTYDSLLFSPHSTSAYPRNRCKHSNNDTYHCSLSLSRSRGLKTISFTFLTSQFFSLCSTVCKPVELIPCYWETDVFKLPFLTGVFPAFYPHNPPLPPFCSETLSRAVSRLPLAVIFCFLSHVTWYGVYDVRSATVTRFSPRSACFCCQCHFCSLSDLYQRTAWFSKTRHSVSARK